MQRRVAAMARHARVVMFQPIPWFPLVATLPDWAERPARESDGFSIRHTPMFYIPGVMKSLDGYWLYRAIGNAIATARQTAHFDVLDAHFAYPEGVGTLLAAKELKLPVFVTLRGFEAEYIEKAVIGGQIRRLLAEVDGCICVSHFLRDLAIENGADPDKTIVIHNAIDRDTFHPASRSDARAKLDLPMGSPLVVSVGHLISRKRHHVLIRAFQRVVSEFGNARLLIIGAESFERQYPGELRQLISELGLGSSVELVGNVPPHGIADYLRAADLFALATQREGCCNALLEALACGIPAVTTPVGDNQYFVRDGENGHIVPVDDVEAMHKAIADALARSDWDGDEISANLGVGTWDDVAVKVLDFMKFRLAEAATQ